jgi:transcriptional antiterminator RfaH
MQGNWYVARTTPHGEYAARDACASAGLEAFLPCVRTQVPGRRSRQETESRASEISNGPTYAPLFPGYLFVRFDLEDYGRRKLLFAPHLRGLVSFGGVVPTVPEEIIEKLEERIGSISDSGGLGVFLPAGTKVTVRMGKTTALGQVLTPPEGAGGRLHVLLEFLGRQITADLPLEAIDTSNGSLPVRVFNSRLSRRTRGKGRWIKGREPQTAKIV